ncbi:hypothetical protein [Rhodanobacter sp. T12-5]|uniref:hypothetical protein n=1 Tax=Rhodanobacter sp. T12-5 TaxID=2024611 RepID=UPI0011ED84A3|nr:hypothetical protein [Rhodanobacter sp. T12-5]KAA0071689.1 hypothetical protein CIW53_00280 [Rhodanobacter sp. T12-5]
MRKIIFLTFAIAAQPAFANSLTYVDAKTLADRDEASVPKAQTQALLDSQGAVISRVIPVCAHTSRPTVIPSFVVVVKLDSSGKVVATWRKGDSNFALCFEKKVSDLTLFAPPYTPFYTSFEINIRPSSEMQKTPLLPHL